MLAATEGAMSLACLKGIESLQWLAQAPFKSLRPKSILFRLPPLYTIDPGSGLMLRTKTYAKTKRHNVPGSTIEVHFCFALLIFLLIFISSDVMV
jgi:hypothetical protein